ncbi:unnamed protein product [Rotaria magnacalcarata]|uniref:Uncharacterized protein n=1 Tax=Rotaria magnacalcarata TaxID=392030 RepID=A0A820S7N9_9BILA|nr:unnamed protein product [Rotaria magnacalcarata]CAF4453744.1 unnamed protein product [Rotaria magnacalcarata]
MSNTPQFDLGSAALQHLELLNCSNQNPLEIAAQFRTLLRSKKANKNVQSSNINYTYTDYIAADATIRRRGRSHSLADQRSKSLGKIQYDISVDQSLPESNSSSSFIKNEPIDNLTDEIYPDSAMGSDSSDLTNHKIDSSIMSHRTTDLNNKIIFHNTSKETTSNSNRFQYPTINWKQLREKQYENKLDKVKKFLSTKFKTIRLSKSETLPTASNKLESYACSNLSDTEKNDHDILLNENVSSSSPRSRSSSSSSSTFIRTPSISPKNSPRSNYTISRLNTTLVNHSHDAIFFPIADCNLIIKQQPVEQTKRMSHAQSLCNQNKLICSTTSETMYI